MDLRSLIESLQRLYLDPRVSPSTPVNVELRYETLYATPDNSVGVASEDITANEPLATIAISNVNGGRSITFSALPRNDAFAR